MCQTPYLLLYLHLPLHTQSQCAAAAAANRAMLRSWRAAAPAAAARQLGSGSAALLELGPGLAGISRPRGIKAVSRSLLSGQQAAMLDHVVRGGGSSSATAAGLASSLACCNGMQKLITKNLCNIPADGVLQIRWHMC